jgi:hypothetical protein
MGTYVNKTPARSARKTLRYLGGISEISEEFNRAAIIFGHAQFIYCDESFAIFIRTRGTNGLGPLLADLRPRDA